jgi:tetratricopeptide (TPR) repeat protein
MQPTRFSDALGFIQAWFGSRAWRRMWLGIPAFASALLVVAGLLARPFTADSHLVSVYGRAFHDALNNKDTTGMLLAHARLNDMGKATEEMTFLTCRILHSIGEREHAVAMARKIAPDDQPGYPAAHLWLASVLMQIPGDDPERVAQIKKHVQWGLGNDTKAETATVLTSVMALSTGQFDEAISELQELPNRDLIAQFYLMLALKAKGDEPGALAEQADLEKQLTNLPRANWTPREFIVQAELLRNRGEYIAVDQLLREAVQKFPDHAVLHEALRRCYLQFSVLIREDVEADKLLQYVAGLFRKRPGDQHAWELLAKAYAEGQLTDRAVVQQVTALPSIEATPPGVLFYLGSRAASAGDYATAQKLLESVCSRDQQNIMARNNLAWVLSKTEPPDLSRAIELVNEALAAAPQSASFLETRGQIYLKRQQWQLAADDLKTAIELGLSPDNEARRALAEAYRALGRNHEAPPAGK